MISKIYHFYPIPFLAGVNTRVPQASGFIRPIGFQTVLWVLSLWGAEARCGPRLSSENWSHTQSISGMTCVLRTSASRDSLGVTLTSHFPGWVLIGFNSKNSVLGADLKMLRPGSQSHKKYGNPENGSSGIVQGGEFSPTKSKGTRRSGASDARERNGGEVGHEMILEGGNGGEVTHGIFPEVGSGGEVGHGLFPKGGNGPPESNWPGGVEVSDRVVTGVGVYPPDTERGGGHHIAEARLTFRPESPLPDSRAPADNIGAGKSGGDYIYTFRLPMDSGDPNDFKIVRGKSFWLILAWSMSPDWDHHSRVREHFIVNMH